MAVLRISTATRNALANAVATLVDADAGAGKILIYGDTIPTDANTAVGSQTLLATVNLADPAFGSASGGVITGTDPASVNAVATETATWFRMTDNSGDTIMDGDVTVTGGGGTMTLSSTSLVSGSPVDITSLTVTMPAS